MHREPEVLEAAAQVGKWLDCRARITSKELAITPSCENFHPPECLFYNSEKGCRFGEKCSNAHRQVDEQPSKKSQKNGDKSAVVFFEEYPTIGLRTLGYGAAEVFIDFAEGRKHTETNPTCTLTKAIARHTKIRDQNPSLGLICPNDPYEGNPSAPKFEDGLKKRRKGKSDMPVKPRGTWQEVS